MIKINAFMSEKTIYQIFFFIILINLFIINIYFYRNYNVNNNSFDIYENFQNKLVSLEQNLENISQSFEQDLSNINIIIDKIKNKQEKSSFADGLSHLYFQQFLYYHQQRNYNLALEILDIFLNDSEISIDLKNKIFEYKNIILHFNNMQSEILDIIDTVLSDIDKYLNLYKNNIHAIDTKDRKSFLFDLVKIYPNNIPSWLNDETIQLLSLMRLNILNLKYYCEQKDFINFSINVKNLDNFKNLGYLSDYIYVLQKFDYKKPEFNIDMISIEYYGDNYVR